MFGLLSSDERKILKRNIFEDKKREGRQRGMDFIDRLWSNATSSLFVCFSAFRGDQTEEDQLRICYEDGLYDKLKELIVGLKKEHDAALDLSYKCRAKEVETLKKELNETRKALCKAEITIGQLEELESNYDMTMKINEDLRSENKVLEDKIKALKSKKRGKK